MVKCISDLNTFFNCRNEPQTEYLGESCQGGNKYVRIESYTSYLDATFIMLYH